MPIVGVLFELSAFKVYVMHQKWSDSVFLLSYPVFEKWYLYQIQIPFWLKSYYPHSKTIWKYIFIITLKSTNVSVCFRGISRLPSAFVFLRGFKLAHTSIQVCTFHDGCKQGIDQQIFNRKSISRKITHPQSWKLQATLTDEKLKGWSNSREKTNSRLQSKCRNVATSPVVLRWLYDSPRTGYARRTKIHVCGANKQ